MPRALELDGEPRRPNCCGRVWQRETVSAKDGGDARWQGNEWTVYVIVWDETAESMAGEE